LAINQNKIAGNSKKGSEGKNGVDTYERSFQESLLNGNGANDKGKTKREKAQSFGAFPLIMATRPSVVVKPGDSKANKADKKLKSEVG